MTEKSDETLQAYTLTHPNKGRCRRHDTAAPRTCTASLTGRVGCDLAGRAGCDYAGSTHTSGAVTRSLAK